LIQEDEVEGGKYFQHRIGVVKSERVAF